MNIKLLTFAIIATLGTSVVRSQEEPTPAPESTAVQEITEVTPMPEGTPEESPSPSEPIVETPTAESTPSEEAASVAPEAVERREWPTLESGVAVQYGTASDGTKLMAFPYLPTGEGPHPAVLIIHGGGFRDDSDFERSKVIAQEAADNGFVAFSINYRLFKAHLPGQTSKGKYPEQTNDCKMAVRFARHYSTTGKVGAIGGSAGGSHAAFINETGTAGRDKTDAAICLSGAYDFANPESLAADANFKRNVMDYAGPTTEGLKVASPITYLASNTSPVFILASVEDSMPPQQFTSMKEKLTSVNATFESTLLPGKKHSFANWDDVKDEILPWIKSKLL